MSVLDYFLLDIGEDDQEVATEPTLGRKPSKDAERNRQRIRQTLGLYFAVALGVLAQISFGVFIRGSTTAQINLNVMMQIGLALVVGATIFPTVYRSAGFNRRKPHIVHYFIAFQNGFFWEAILQSLAK